MGKKTVINITKSSGNVFEDLELPSSEECLVKARLAYKINELIREKQLKQIEAAHLLRVDQPKISALSRGILSGFSIERLFKFLAILNQDIEIIIRPHKTSKQTSRNLSHVQVRYA